jgi:hypothetical protein
MRSRKSDMLDILLDEPPPARRPRRIGRSGRTGGTGRSSATVVRLAWSAVPVVTLGILAWAPFLFQAVRRRTRATWGVVGAYLAGSVLALVFAVRGNPPDSGTTSNGLSTAGGFISLSLMIVGAVHCWIVLRPGALAPPRYGPGALPDVDPNTSALARAAMETRHRVEARAILARDPAMARDLMIGRPDLARSYDDGGLVDVNHVPAEVLCAKLGWSADEAAAVVEYRESVGLFTSADELVVYAPLGPDRVDPVADLLVFRAV